MVKIIRIHRFIRSEDSGTLFSGFIVCLEKVNFSMDGTTDYFPHQFDILQFTKFQSILTTQSHCAIQRQERVYLLPQMQLFNSQMPPNIQIPKIPARPQQLVKVAMNFQIETVIEALLGADNQRRSAAEKLVDELPSTNFQQGIDQLLLSMNNQNAQISAMGALLLKKKYLDIKQNFDMIPKDKLEIMVRTVQGCMTVQRPQMFLKRCCDILVKIYTFVDQKRELMVLIQTMSHTDSAAIKITLMYLIEIICEFAFDDKLLMEYAGGLEAIFQAGMNDETSNQVRVAAFKTLTVFLASIQDAILVKRFEGVLQMLLQKAIQLIKYDQESGITAVESINELVEAHPKFIKPIFRELLMVYTEVMEGRGLLVNLRISAMFGVLTLAMNHASLMRKSTYFKENMVPAYMKMLTENEAFPLQQWAQQLNEQIISKNDIALSTQEHLSQLLNELGSKFMLPLFIKYIQQALQSVDPCALHAGLTAMAILTEGCHESYKKDLQGIIGMMTPLLQTQNPRVIHDLLVAFGYMAQEFAPDFQRNHGDMVLMFINRAMQHPYPKVQYKAVQCIQNFQKGIKEHSEDAKILLKYINEMLGSLGKIFQYSLSTLNCLMLQAVLDSIATIASMNSFAQYYVTFMPGLKRILGVISNDSAQKVMIRSKTVETMGYLLSSVKDTQELFLPDCKEIMESLIQMSASLDKDDPMLKATFIVYENVANCLKADFLPYLEIIFPRLLESINRKVDFTVVSEGESEQPKNSKNQYVKMKLDFKIDGLKNLVLNTDTLEQKLQAGSVLTSIAQDMGMAYQPFIEKTIPTINDLLSFKNSKQLRSNMIQLSKHLVEACGTPEQKLFVLGSILPAMLKELSTVIRTRDYEETNQIVEVLAELMPFMGQEMKMKMLEVMAGVLQAVKSLTREIERIYADKDMDDDLQEEMDEETEDVQEVLSDIERIIRIGNSQEFEALKKHFPKEYEFQQM